MWHRIVEATSEAACRGRWDKNVVKRTLVIAVLVGIQIPVGTIAYAQRLDGNPAFCVDLLKAYATAEKQNLTLDERGARVLYSKIGPKDSTDEREFDDWLQIGREAGVEIRAGGYDTQVRNCLRLLGAEIR